MKQFYHLPLRKSIAFGLLLCSMSFYAQISNNNNPHPSAALDINATNKGLLLPRVALTGTADVTTIPAPAISLVVYHTTTVAGMPEGFYYWNGIRWESLSNEAVTHAFASAVNTLTSTVNGVQKTAPIINTNALSLTGTNLTSTVNGKASTALNLASIVPATTNVLTSNTNTLTSTVNNVPKTAPIINTNALALTGTNLTSTVNGVTSNTLSLATLAGWSLAGNAGTAAANFLGTTDNQPLRFRTNNTEKMTITAAGNVGIGNTAPNAPLQFNTGEASRKVVLYDNKNNDHEFYGFGINASLLRSQINAVSASFGWFAGVNATTSNELMRLGGNGALSLGTATGTATMTGARLDVAKGEVRFQNLLSNGAATDDIITITSTGYLKKRAISSLAAWNLDGNAATVTDYIGTKATANPFIIKTSSAATGTGATPTERMRIDKDGVVTIGNVAGSRLAFSTAPAATDANSRRIVLHLGANDNQYRGFGIYSNVLVSQVDATAANFLWRAGTNATTSNELMRLTGTGNLGIGIAPIQKLHVAGKAIITTMDAGVAADQIVTVDAAGLLKKRTLASVVPPTTNTLALNGTNLTSTVNGVPSNTLSLATLAGWSLTGNAIGAAANFLGTTDNQPLRFRTNNTEKMTITAAGNVGIGTTTPNAPLQFGNAGVWRKIVLYENANNDTQFIGFGASANSFTASIANSTSNYSWFAGASATARTELMRLTGTGKLGLGNSAPTYSLDVVSTANDELLASFLPQNKTQGVAIGYSGISKIASTANSDFKISPKGTGKVNIDGPALVKTLPAGAVGEQVVVVDGSNNLKKIAATSVGKTYTGSNGITVSGTNITAQTTTALWNANQLQGRAVATTAPATGQILRYNGSTWQPYTTATYSPTLIGTLGTGTTLPTSDAPVYTKAYITLPANSKYIITVNMLATSHPNKAPNNSSLWIRSWFSNSSTNSTMTGDIIGGGLVSGNVPPNSLYNLISGTVILYNNSGAAKTYYYWAKTGERNGNSYVINTFADRNSAENQMFAVPIDN